MSWHFLQGQEVASWEDSSLDGAPSALLNLMPTAATSCSPDSATATSTRSPSGMTCEPSTENLGGVTLMSLVEDSPARTSQRPAKAQASTVSAVGSGATWRESLAKYDPTTRSWRTAQASLLGGLDEFLATWPRWGWMRGGAFSPLPTPALPTFESAYGYLPTPRAIDSRGVAQGTADATLLRRAESSFGVNLAEWVQMETRRLFPTPRVFMHKDSTTDRGKGNLGEVIGGALNPPWVEWLMGWPIEWTALEPLATDRFRQWCDSHGKP